MFSTADQPQSCYQEDVLLKDGAENGEGVAREWDWALELQTLQSYCKYRI